jgi:hypothetical protein
MALPVSGALKFSDINLELGLNATDQLALGSTIVRNLYGVGAGAIRLGLDGYGKSVTITPQGISEAAPVLLFQFTNTAESFTAQGATITTGATFLTVSSNGIDPLIRRTVSFSGLVYPYIEIMIFRSSGSTWDGKIFYSTASHGESASFYKQIPEPIWDGANYQYVLVDMRDLTFGGNDWQTNTITNIRFDFGASADDVFLIDYIQFRGLINPLSGLYRYSKSGYFNDDTSFFNDATSDNTSNTTINFSISTSNISYQWVGYFLAPTTGTYSFRTNSDDASYLWFGNTAITGFNTSNALVNNGGPHQAQVIVGSNIELTANTYYPMRLQYGNGGGTGVISVSYSGPGISLTSNGTNRYFYNGDTLGI